MSQPFKSPNDHSGLEVPSTQESSTDISTRSIRSKTDATWKYVTEEIRNGKKSFICDFCKKRFNGGGITRMKKHLAGVAGDVCACKQVKPEVRYEMKCLLNATSHKGKRKKGNIEDLTLEEAESNDDLVGSVTTRKRQAISEIDAYFTKGVSDPSQPSIKACMQSTEKWKETDLAVALWFYDACIPFNAANSSYFQPAVDRIISMGHGYKHPTFHALRLPLLNDAKRHVGLIVDSLRQTWVETGCTIMGDGWTDCRQRPLINFLVYCPKGISFIKSVDASDIYTNAENLCNLFSEIVEMVGPTNVVHVVTDNGANYKAAGALLMEKYKGIYWSPCAAHCINLVLKDVGDMEDVKAIVGLASQITVFVYNHKVTLNWLRKRPGWKEIIRPGATRFATSFIALQSLYDHKHDLEALVVSNEFKQFLKKKKAKDVKNTVLSETFWENCSIFVKVMDPIMKLLRLCDTDENPSLGYIYEGMYRARNGIMKTFKYKPENYQPYIDILDRRWDRMLRQDLHAAAYYLNPAFQYDPSFLCKNSDVMRGMMNLVDRVEEVESNAMIDELRIFREREKCFSRPKALACSKTTLPDEWWRNFGYDAPNLQKLAIRVLCQTASSSGCERNWNVFERIHSKKRNRLEHERLNDLVYVHYNLRLRNRLSLSKRPFDPIDYETIDDTEYWIIEKEGELDMDELENMLLEEPIIGADDEEREYSDVD